ncbi:MAG TPA: FAD-dependent oxidoreductase [Jatrophihabitantaceae bacterium]|nr:FAD-dependent oxidoreductase [Jatrophihabitantaceae bacterium]
MSRDYRSVSLWFDTVADELTPRPALTGDQHVDVAIVGAGYTGLWTAYYLLAADPALRVAIIERDIAGFGASGRNGGWCSALFPVSVGTLAREAGRDAAIAQYRAMAESVDEVGRVVAAEGIDADFAHGGTVVVARNEPQLHRARDEVAEYERFGLELELLGADDARRRLNADGVLGGTYTSRCAALHPAKLVRGLARAVESRGGRLYEQTPAVSIEPHAVRTPHGTLSADVIVRATEGYTAQLPGQRRAIVPVYSLIVATEPLPDAVWDEIGLRDRETWSDHRHLIVYGQRTADDRMVFGGRGAPYHLRSRIKPEYDRVPRVFAGLERALAELFPVLAGTPITHRWGGPLGIARDWHPFVRYDASSGIAEAGGYVGDGVSTANLAGRTLADLVTGRPSDLTTLPWVGHRSRSWEPEPLRWLGANAALRAMTWADAAERRRARPSRLARAVDAMMGR